jgi:hypothetical protein
VAPWPTETDTPNNGAGSGGGWLPGGCACLPPDGGAADPPPGGGDPAGAPDPFPAGGEPAGVPVAPLPDRPAGRFAAADAGKPAVPPGFGLGAPFAPPAEVAAAGRPTGDDAVGDEAIGDEAAGEVADRDVATAPAEPLPSAGVADAGPESGVFAGGVSGAEATRVAWSVRPSRETATPLANSTSSAEQAASQTTALLRCESTNECSPRPQPQPVDGT